VNIKPEFAALIERGNVTTADIENLRGNSWDWEALTQAYTDETLIERVEHAITNVGRPRSGPSVTYNEAIIHRWAPELIRRLRSRGEKT